MIHDPATCKLGKKPPVFPKGMRMLAEVTAKLREPPANVGWTKGKIDPVTGWGMDGNDKIGLCALAAPAHLLQAWTTLNGSPIVPTTLQVIGAYTDVTGYNPADPSTDMGTDPMAMLAYWKATGLWGTKIEDFFGVNPQSQTQIKDSIWFYGGALCGLQLPISAQNQEVWDVPAGGAVGDGAPGSWGGHEIVLIYAGLRLVGGVTWGSEKYMTYEFLATYCDQLTAVRSTNWVTNGLTPGGVPMTSLTLDASRLQAS